MREDALQLFGFATEEEEAVFHELLGVKNVGPRAAQNILSGIGARELARRSPRARSARLTKVPGVGRKTAERLVLELEKVKVLPRSAPAPAARSGDEGARAEHSARRWRISGTVRRRQRPRRRRR